MHGWKRSPASSREETASCYLYPLHSLFLLFVLGREKVPGDVRQQAPEQDQPGGVRPGHAVLRRRLPVSALRAARGILRPPLRLPPHAAGNYTP